MTLRIFSLAIALVATVSASALSASSYATSSKLASGHWVKVRVTESGMQQITHEQLREWGFSDPSKVTVHGSGGVTGYNEVITSSFVDDLPAQPVVYCDDKIVFYGEADARQALVYLSGRTTPVPGVDRNHCADAGYYFVTDSQPIATPSKIAYSPSSSTSYDWHYCVNFVEEEVDNPFKMGQLYFGRDISTATEPQKLTFDLIDRNTTSSPHYANIYVRHCYVGSGSNLAFDIDYSLNSGTASKTLYLYPTGTNALYGCNHESVDSHMTVKLDSGVSQFQYAYQVSSVASMNYAALDYISVAYARINNLGDRSELLMLRHLEPYGSSHTVYVNNADVQIWEVRNAYNVRPFETVYNAAAGTMKYANNGASEITSTRPYGPRVIAFNPTAQHRTVEFAEEVANQDLHALATPDLLIISSDLCYNEALRLADIHRNYLGQTVHVLRQGEIFNEYSSGTPSLFGLRRIVKAFYERRTGSIPKLLLFGGAMYDNKGLTPTGKSLKESGTLLLNYGTPSPLLMSTVSTAFSCDAYFGITDDCSNGANFFVNAMRVAVGRIPATNELAAAQYVDKVERYLQHYPTSDIYNQVMLLADNGDTSTHLVASEGFMSTISSNIDNLTYIKGYVALYDTDGNRSPYLTAAIDQALNRGTSLIMYAGHGRNDAITSELVMTTQHIGDLKNEHYPIGMFATCDTYNFDQLGNALVEQLVMSPDNGLIGAVGACRTVYQSDNEVLANSFCKAYGRAVYGTTAAEIFRQARYDVMSNYNDSSNNAMINTSCYNYCGDPAIPIPIASDIAVIETVNGSAYVDTKGAHTITPLVPNTITGYIKLYSNDDPSFYNGKVLLALYEAPYSRYEETDTHSIELDEDILVEATGEVVNGRFTVTFTPPVPSRSGEYNRLTLAVVDQSTAQAASCRTTSLVVSHEAPSDVVDEEAPVIDAFYAESPEYDESTPLPSSFVVYATVLPDACGLRTSTGNIGGAAHIVIDGTKSIPVVGAALALNADGSASIKCPVTDLSDGRHQLTLYIYDNAGNVSTRTISILVVNSEAAPSLSVDESPARVQATFNLSHNFIGDVTGRLVVEDGQGNTVFTKSDVTFPYEWDLTDTEGNLVSDGVYRARVFAKGGSLYGTTAPIDIIVVQKQ